MSDFVPTKRSKVRRLMKRAHYDRETVYAILDAGLLAHVGYVIDGQPYVTPTCVWREEDRLYWHGSVASRMLRTITTGVPCCVTVSLMDGLVLARSGFHSSINYRCVMAFGQAEVIEDPEYALKALEAFIERITPGRWQELRAATKIELNATTVVGMTIEEASAKVRTGGPVDEEEDYALDIWAGVVPLTTVAGTPIPDDRLKPGVKLPSNLEGYELEPANRRRS